ncbi:MAG: Asp-tRNA(Asn)/Glu-tRNA(Gln) amidotransferase subunit GatC [Candidatus Glassbacteria bacterium]|nr:Asp-tRNA(Asn)/Glu-tRNA(Gln) amidotransferase subunit GatC [Candidatus Glassbacteria bacterium]
MAVSKEEVRKIADLARLRLDEAETGRMTRDMNEILDYVDKLNEVDTENVSPLSWLEGKRTPMQDDRVVRFDNTGQALKNAPRSEGRFFIVPRVIE